ncbi:MAG: hypothetical protein ACREO5_06165 [Candidatus Binatia bacterium]
MTKHELVERLKSIAETSGDPEAEHSRADKALLEYIADKEVSAAFDAVEKWYA